MNTAVPRKNIAMPTITSVRDWNRWPATAIMKPRPEQQVEGVEQPLELL